MISRKATIFICVLGLLLCLCLLCLHGHLYVLPQTPALPTAHLQKVTKEQEHIQNHEGLNLCLRGGTRPPYSLSHPALVIPCLGPFSNCLSCSYLHSPFTSSLLILPPRLPSFALHSCWMNFLSDSFPSFDKRLSLLHPILSPSLLLLFPSFSLTTANGSPWLHGIYKHLQWGGAIHSDLCLVLGAYLALLANALCSAAWLWLYKGPVLHKKRSA